MHLEFSMMRQAVQELLKIRLINNCFRRFARFQASNLGCFGRFWATLSQNRTFSAVISVKYLVMGCTRMWQALASGRCAFDRSAGASSPPALVCTSSQ